MHEQQSSIEDLKQIRSIMERSSTFLSLSGFSGVIVGFIALTASMTIGILCKTPILTSEVLIKVGENSHLRDSILVVFVTAFFMALTIAYVFSMNKAKVKALPIFNKVSLIFASHLFTPLLVGGVFIIGLVSKSYYDLVLPSMLIFYGLSLISGSKYTLPEIAFLGMSTLGLGLIGAFLVPYALLLWAAGFGICNICYGLFIYSKYEK